MHKRKFIATVAGALAAFALVLPAHAQVAGKDYAPVNPP